MGIDFIGRPKHDVHVAAVGLPSGDAGGEVLVGVGDAAVVFFLKLVFFGVGGGIAALPEGLNELVALFVVGELHERGFFFVADDPANIFVEPLAVGFAQLDFKRLGIGLFLLFRERALQGIGLSFLSGGRTVESLSRLVLSHGNDG